MCNKSALDYIEKEVNNTLYSVGLSKLSPILLNGDFTERNDGINIGYYIRPEIRRLGQIEFDKMIRELIYTWYVIRDIAIRRFRDKNKVKVDIYRIDDSPIYIKTFHTVLNKLFKHPLLIIDDYLPISFNIGVKTDIDIEKERNDMLGFFTPQGVPFEKKRGVQDLIDNKDITLQDALERIVLLTGQDIRHNYSYCLFCGVTTDVDKKFCNSTNMGYSNRDNCRNKMRYRLARKLRIQNKHIRANKLEALFQELGSLIKIRPLFAFEELKKFHPEVYS